MKIAESLKLQSRAAAVIPGMTQLLSKRPEMFSQGVWPSYFRNAKGVEVEDIDGNRYLDFSIGGIGATVLGYADEEVNAAVIDAVRKGSASSLNPPEEVELAEKLLELHPWAQMARFARSGGEAMAVAVRIARTATGRSKVIFCGYHGWMDWYLAANVGTENALGEHLLAGLKPNGVPRQLAGTAIPFKFNDSEDFLLAFKAAGGDLAAIVMEPARNYMPDPEFMATIHRAACENGIPLVMDEISAGFRICNGGAHLKLGWEPDIAVFAKALGNGIPISAVIGKAQFMNAAQDSFISSTNWTERLGPVAALAMINKFVRVNASEHLVAVGETVEAGWRCLADKYGLKIHISGIKPMLHFRFDRDHDVNRTYYTQEMVKRGFLAGMTFYSMYAHTFEQVERYLAATDEVWGELARLGGPDAVTEKLEGEIATSGFKRIN